MGGFSLAMADGQNSSTNDFGNKTCRVIGKSQPKRQELWLDRHTAFEVKTFQCRDVPRQWHTGCDERDPRQSDNDGRRDPEDRIDFSCSVLDLFCPPLETYRDDNRENYCNTNYSGARLKNW